ncbi:MAG: hypothetical protein ACC619_08585 [Paracoccaceae bacterium]
MVRAPERADQSTEEDAQGAWPDDLSGNPRLAAAKETALPLPALPLSKTARCILELVIVSGLWMTA